VPSTHEGLSILTPWRSVIYVRDLLASSGVLPPVDRFPLLFDNGSHLPRCDRRRRPPSDPATFAISHVMQRLRTRAE
jgi:hypothetical protein